MKCIGLPRLVFLSLFIQRCGQSLQKVHAQGRKFAREEKNCVLAKRGRKKKRGEAFRPHPRKCSSVSAKS
jgi:hypothetical protein